MTSQLSAALCAAAAGLHPDEAGTGLIISHGAFLAPGHHRHSPRRRTALVNISLGAAEAVEGPPSSCSSWMAGSRPNHDPASVSLTRFVGCKAYGVESLRDDLAASYSCSAAPSNGARRR